METHISINHSAKENDKLKQLNPAPARMSVKQRGIKRINWTAAFSYISISVLILSILSVGYTSNQQQDTVFGAVSASAEEEVSSIDQVAAASLAADVAQATDISVETNVANLSTSLNARAALAQASQDFASKPQMLSESLSNAIVNYTVKKGDSLPKIAAAHEVSQETIKWANDLSDNTVGVGDKLRIPTVDGVVYTVRDGDTAAKLAKKYKADQERIVSFNNAELSGLKAGKVIIIPGGTLPANERPGYEAPQASTGFASSGGSSAAGYSTPERVPFTPSYNVGYPFGWCTYYAAAKSGAPGNWGNANTWDDYAAMTPGWTVSGTPVVGAIAQRDGGYGGLGHVAIVEAVSADGSKIQYSDMNGLAGFGGVGRSGWVSAGEYTSYIYR